MTVRRRNLMTVLLVGGVGLLLGGLYALAVDGLRFGPIANGMVIGGVIAGAGTAAELWWFRRFLKRRSFIFSLLVRSIFYAALIAGTSLVVIALYQSRKAGVSFVAGFQQPGFNLFLTNGEFLSVVVISIAGSLSINFFREINRLVGHNALLAFLTGRYHRPLVESRVFMFLDLNDSTTIAERLGPIAWHNLLNDFFFDCTDPVLRSKGTIYQYVGDEIVITWPLSKGLRNADCVRCFFRITEKIASERKKYEEKYGLCPEFKAGLHCGMVVTGEIGDVKQEIVHHGDTVNTTSRILNQCHQLGRPILFSEALALALPGDRPGIELERLGSFALKGKASAVALYTIQK